MSNIIYNKTFNFNAKKDAFPYQKEAFDTIKDLQYSAIFHEQGLGKTKIAIDLILYWLEKKGIDSVIVVTKKQLIRNWEEEFNFHTHLKPAVLNDDKMHNYYVLNGTSRVILTNFETISSDNERIKLYLQTRDVGMILDESTKIKNPDSNITQKFFDISQLIKIRVIMTGTPVANRPYDIWSQIYFLDNGKSLGKDFNDFKRDCDLSNDLYKNDHKRKDFELTVSSIFNKISTFTVRETKSKGVVKLPNKVYYDVLCDFEKAQAMMYEKIREECRILIQKGDNAILDESDDVLKRLLRLIQVASNPRLIDEFYGNISGKEVKLRKLVEEIVERGEKVIIWTSFIENVNFLYQIYSSYNPAKVHGSLAIEYRNKSIEKFKKDNTCKILFATPQSAKEGLTLTIANNVIFYDRTFNLDDYLQAQDRIHRISQTKTCNIYKLIMKDSIDLWIDSLLEAKQNAAFLAQGDFGLKKYAENMSYNYGEMIKEILNIKK